MIVACLLSPMATWKMFGPVLLFIGLLIAQRALRLGFAGLDAGAAAARARTRRVAALSSRAGGRGARKRVHCLSRPRHGDRHAGVRRIGRPWRR